MQIKKLTVKITNIHSFCGLRVKWKGKEGKEYKIGKEENELRRLEMLCK